MITDKSQTWSVVVIANDNWNKPGLSNLPSGSLHNYFHLPVTSSRQLKPNLWEAKDVSTSVTGVLKIAPTENLSEESKSLIGAHGVERFESFKSYQKGWGHGKGNPVSPYSIGMTELFLMTFHEHFKDTPSIFLSYNGNLQLSWEDSEGGRIELEFGINKVEYFIEKDDKEGFVDFENKGNTFQKSLSGLVNK